MQQLKRIIVVLLTLTMCFSSLPTSAIAEVAAEAAGTASSSQSAATADNTGGEDSTSVVSDDGTDENATDESAATSESATSESDASEEDANVSDVVDASNMNQVGDDGEATTPMVEAEELTLGEFYELTGTWAGTDEQFAAYLEGGDAAVAALAESAETGSSEADASTADAGSSSAQDDENTSAEGSDADASAADASDYDIALASLDEDGSDSTVSLLSDELPEADGTRIEGIKAAWITKNYDDTDASTTNGRLTLKPTKDDDLTARLRVTYQVSGQYDYEPGDLTITIPKDIFKLRDGTSAAGVMTMSVPEAPDTTATFNYVDTGTEYVITNTKKLSAATSAMFELSFREIVPHEVCGNPSHTEAVTAPFTATINVTTKSGKTLSLTSNKIDAVIDTAETVTTASDKVYDFSTSWPESWPESLKPKNADGSDASDDYVYVDFYSYAVVNGNQTYSLSSAHSVSGSSSTGGTLTGSILGLSSGGNLIATGSASGTTSLTGSLGEDLYVSDGRESGFVHCYAAFPKSQVQTAGVTYYFKDAVTYTLTSTDDQQVTTATSSAQRDYTVRSYALPSGHYEINKSGTQASNDGYLNLLRNNKNVDLRYRIHTFLMDVASTAEDVNKDCQYSADELGLKSRSFTVDDIGDTGWSIIGNTNLTAGVKLGNTALTAGTDYVFKGIYVAQPEAYTYQQFETSGSGYREVGSGSSSSISKGTIGAGEWGYKQEGAIPSVDVYAKTDGTNYEKYATVSWSSEADTGSCTTYKGAVATAAGSYETGPTITFNADVTNIRIVYSTTTHGVVHNSYPIVTLKPSTTVQSAIETLYANSDTPETYVWNTATGVVTNSEDKALFTDRDEGENEVTGAAQAVGVTKTVKDENDQSHRQVKLHYTVTSTNQSNVTSSSMYEELMSQNILERDSSGTFYDLLPAGVEADLTSIAPTRSGDTIDLIRTFPDYNDSGRTLIMVKMSFGAAASYGSAYSIYGYGERHGFSYDAAYSYDSLSAYGRSFANLVAYRSPDASYGSVRNRTGEPDNPSAGKNNGSAALTAEEKLLMKHLIAGTTGEDEPASPGNSFVYSRAASSLSYDMHAETSLSKQVSAGGGDYGNGQGDNPVNVYEGGSYTYRISQTNPEGTTTSGIMLYDSLETYTPGSAKDDGSADLDDNTWQGSFVGIDVSEIEYIGVAPKVYYSTTSGLDLRTQDSGDLLLSSTKANWTLSTNYTGDFSAVKAICIDCTKGSDGKDFTLPELGTLTAYINMKAPTKPSNVEDDDWYDTELGDNESEAGGTGGAHAYNDTAMVAALTTKTGTENEFVWNHYTKVGLLPYEVQVKKSWSDDNNRDGKRPDSMTVQLYADGEAYKDAEGNAKTLELSSSNNWSGTFGTVPRMDGTQIVTYSVKEVAYTTGSTTVNTAPKGYDLTFTTSTSTVTTTAGYKKDVTTVSLTNTHEPEVVSISGTKRWDDSLNAAGARPSTIELKLYKIKTVNGKETKSLYATKTVTGSSTAESWDWSFDNLYKYEKGVELGWRVTEEAYVPGYTTEGMQNGTATDGTASVTNTYNPYGTLKISKTLGTDANTPKDKEFTYTVTVKRTVTNASTGEKTTEIDGGTYSWKKYYADGTEVEGGTGTVANGSTVTLKGGQYIVLSGVPSEWDYSVEETVPSGWRITSRTGTTGSIKAGKESAAAFTNSYSAKGKITLTAKKTLRNGTLTGRQFGFKLYDAKGNVLSTAYNDPSGNVSFGAINYTLADVGPHYYTMKEIVPDAAQAYDATTGEAAEGLTWATASDEQKASSNYVWKLNSITYDRKDVSITVNVENQGNGTLKATPTYSKGGTEASSATFTNAYKADGNLTITAY